MNQHEKSACILYMTICLKGFLWNDCTLLLKPSNICAPTWTGRSNSKIYLSIFLLTQFLKWQKIYIVKWSLKHYSNKYFYNMSWWRVEKRWLLEGKEEYRRSNNKTENWEDLVDQHQVAIYLVSIIMIMHRACQIHCITRLRLSLYEWHYLTYLSPDNTQHYNFYTRKQCFSHRKNCQGCVTKQSIRF